MFKTQSLALPKHNPFNMTVSKATRSLLFEVRFRPERGGMERAADLTAERDPVTRLL